MNSYSFVFPGYYFSCGERLGQELGLKKELFLDDFDLRVQIAQLRNLDCSAEKFRLLS